MKRLVFFIALILLLVGCDDKTNYIAIDSYRIDMSGYVGLNKDGHNFVGVMPEEMLRIIDEKGSGIFYIGSIYCAHCQNVANILDEVAKTNDMTINYINAANDMTPYLQEMIDVFYDFLYEDKDGDKEIQMPMVISIKNGKVLNCLIGEHPYDEYDELFKTLN